MQTQTRESIEKLVENNLGLVKKRAGDYCKKANGRLEYDELFSEGLEALYKAAQNYDESKNQFSTYAYKSVGNKLCSYVLGTVRKKRGGSSIIVSLDAPIETDESKNELNLYGLVRSGEFEEMVEKRDDFIRTMNIILNALKEKEIIVMLYTMAGESQATIGQKFNVTRMTISNILKDARSSIQRYMRRNSVYAETFSIVALEEEFYQISFRTNKMVEIKEILNRQLEELRWDIDVSIFDIKYDGDEIKIQFSLQLEAFFMLAEIM